MKSRISAVVGIAAICGISAFAWMGCSEDEKPKTQPAPITECDEAKDPLNPPIACGPAEAEAPKCSSTSNVASCPASECMATVEQTGTTKNLRMGRIRLWAPASLQSLAAIAVDPNVNPKCANNGAESFTWLIQVDESTKKVKTGGARASTDNGKTFGFLDESVNAAKLNDICPGFLTEGELTGAAEVDLRPVTADYRTNSDGSISMGPVPLINVPIFDSSGLPIILPLRSASINNTTIKGSCVGKFEKDYWCDGDTLGWTTGGAIIAKITAEDADRVPVKSAGCQSLCAILANDATKTEGKRCKRVGGKVPEIGTHCAAEGGSCKDSFLLSATFGAYGVNITTVAPPPMDSGTDTGSDTGGDTGSGDTGVSDAADAASDGG